MHKYTCLNVSTCNRSNFVQTNKDRFSPWSPDLWPMAPFICHAWMAAPSPRNESLAACGHLGLKNDDSQHAGTRPSNSLVMCLFRCHNDTPRGHQRTWLGCVHGPNHETRWKIPWNIWLKCEMSSPNRKGLVELRSAAVFWRDAIGSRLFVCLFVWIIVCHSH